MRVIIAGSRTARYADVVEAITHATGGGKNLAGITEVVCGMATGADTHGRTWARAMDIPVREFPADWDKHGKSAGMIRNKQMAGYADAALVVWDGVSRGSKDMICRIKKLRKPLFVWVFVADAADERVEGGASSVVGS